MGYKGVICYNMNTQKCIISRHVIFYETVFPSLQRTCSNGSISSKTVHQWFHLFKDRAPMVRQSMPSSTLPSTIVIPIPVSTHRVNLQSQIDSGSRSTQSVNKFNDGSTSLGNSGNSSVRSQSTSAEQSSSGHTLFNDNDTSLLLHVFDPAQLQVLLPISLFSSINSVSHDSQHVNSFVEITKTYQNTNKASNWNHIKEKLCSIYWYITRVDFFTISGFN